MRRHAARALRRCRDVTWMGCSTPSSHAARTYDRVSSLPGIDGHITAEEDRLRHGSAVFQDDDPECVLQGRYTHLKTSLDVLKRYQHLDAVFAGKALRHGPLGSGERLRRAPADVPRTRRHGSIRLRRERAHGSGHGMWEATVENSERRIVLAAPSGRQSCQMLWRRTSHLRQDPAYRGNRMTLPTGEYQWCESCRGQYCRRCVPFQDHDADGGRGATPHVVVQPRALVHQTASQTPQLGSSDLVAAWLFGCVL
jgi:hypothetical protein